MHLSVLKNRLLQRTQRQFQEASYGANTMLEIVGRFPDLLEVRNEQPPSVMFLIQQIDKQRRDQTTARSDDHDVSDFIDSSEDFQSVLDEYRKSGDNLSVGEEYAALFKSADEAEVERIFANVVSNWASADPLAVIDIADLVRNVDNFVSDHLARAVVHATLRMEEAQRNPPPKIGDIYYRVTEPLKQLLLFQERASPKAIVRTATVKIKELRSSLDVSVASFCRSTSASAKIPSTDVIRHAHAYAPYALPSERQTLRDVEVLLGPLFRKFCESCERHEANRIPRRAKDLRYQLQRTLDSLRVDSSHRLKKTILEPIAIHISHLLEEGTRTSEEMTTPSIRIASNTIKLDLDQGGHVVFPVRVVNDGDGPARSVRVEPPKSTGSPTLSVLEPPEPFDLSPRTDRLILMSLDDFRGNKEITLDAVFQCETVNGGSRQTNQRLTFEQQFTQPDWESLLRNPPYRINPIRQRTDLYGRRSILGELELHVSNETSVFLWGQKRIGKTSVLQVLANNLKDRADIVCVILRMGELASLHEGQMAHTIAVRLADVLGRQGVVPTEEEFGAGLGRLIPFVEQLRSAASEKLLVIVDEFDDLNPAFYLGERGKQFVKALRSLSEVGLTFMFVGSERMDAIYGRHSADLNKWASSSLDRIEEASDCEALIVQPVLGKIEYDRFAVKRIVEYCQGNPFYMHLIAGKIFQRCAQERRTFVGSDDFEYVHLKFVHELGPTNFAHLWEDVPELDPDEKLRVVANNCLFLACVARLGSGGYEALDDLILAQDELRLEITERLLRQDAQEVENGLLQRRVLSKRMVGDTSHTEVKLPIFRDWLLKRGEAELMRRRIAHLRELDVRRHVNQPILTRTVDHAFPIDEDALLSVAERLVFLGKHKDVAEVRRWLRQFDDDGRIEIAFLLLERLVDRGFVSEGMSTNGLEKMQATIKARRQEVGDGAWRMVRRRRDNLCIGYVDSEVKSGATTARELGKRMRPGKCGGVDGMSTWLRGHWDEDPILVVVDDFAGTGATLVKGLRGLWSQDEGLFSEAAREGRILCCLQTVLPEAIDRIERQFPNVVVLPMTTFDDDVRAFATENGIFENDDDRAFAKEVMLQIGRQLVPQNPLGFGNIAALVSFHNTVPNNTLPVFWCHGVVNGREWKPLIPRGTFGS